MQYPPDPQYCFQQSVDPLFSDWDNKNKMAPMPPHAVVKETNEKLEKTQVLQKWLDENQYSRLEY
jgi:hypothetical protein